MKQSLDFLDIKTVLRYLAKFAFVLIGGAIAKDIFVLLVVGTILVNVFRNKLFESVELWLIWFISFGFYTGQGFLTNDVISKYIAKPSFLLLVIFIYFYSVIPAKIKYSRSLRVWLAFIVLSILSLWFHGKPPLVLITFSSFFMLYLLLTARSLNKMHCKKLLNFFIAVAILQSCVCVLQVGQFIAPPSKMMDDGSGGQFEWIAGLDDVSSGTFGPVTAHVVSWYASLTALFCILIWTRTKKNKYLVVTVISVLQFATVDSKTIMAVMIAMMGYLLYYLNKQKVHFRLNTQKILMIIMGGATVGYGLLLCLNFYYQYQHAAGGVSTRGSLNDVYKQEIQTSRDLVLANITDWGKIQGFHYVFNDFISENAAEVIFGYSLLGYDYNGKMSYIERQDTPLMQLNNFTRSRSSLITLFAESGIAGFVLLLMTIYQWSKFNKTKRKLNEIDLVINSLLNIFLPFTLVAAFIYDISLTTITVIIFAGLIAVLKRYSALPVPTRIKIKYYEKQHQELYSTEYKSSIEPV